MCSPFNADFDGVTLNTAAQSSKSRSIKNQTTVQLKLFHASGDTMTIHLTLSLKLNQTLRFSGADNLSDNVPARNMTGKARPNGWLSKVKKLKRRHMTWWCPAGRTTKLWDVSIGESYYVAFVVLTLQSTSSETEMTLWQMLVDAVRVVNRVVHNLKLLCFEEPEIASSRRACHWTYSRYGVGVRILAFAVDTTDYSRSHYSFSS